MSLGAIVVVANAEVDLPRICRNASVLQGEAMPCMEVAGRSITERIIDRYLAAGIGNISLLIEAPLLSGAQPPRVSSPQVSVQVITDIRSAISETLSNYSSEGIEQVFVHWADAYVETDLLDLFYFHAAARQSVTCAYDREGSLPLWLVDCERGDRDNLATVVDRNPQASASYVIQGYSRRFSEPRSLREFAVDILEGRCESRPSGEEAKPGIWIDAGAEIHRGARVVAPAYIGRGSKIMDEALITRSSSVETNCVIDCGTVVENSSILANTRVGIWLDVCRAVVNGSYLLSLARDVTVEIADTSLVRPLLARGRAKSAREWDRIQDHGPSVGTSPALPEAWGFGANLLQD